MDGAPQFTHPSRFFAALPVEVASRVKGHGTGLDIRRRLLWNQGTIGGACFHKPSVLGVLGRKSKGKGRTHGDCNFVDAPGH